MPLNCCCRGRFQSWAAAAAAATAACFSRISFKTSSSHTAFSSLGFSSSTLRILLLFPSRLSLSLLNPLVFSVSVLQSADRKWVCRSSAGERLRSEGWSLKWCSSGHFTWPQQKGGGGQPLSAPPPHPWNTWGRRFMQITFAQFYQKPKLFLEKVHINGRLRNRKRK